MESKFRANNPAGIEFTMEITMTMREWEQLAEQLTDAYPSWDLSTRIDSLIAQAKKTFYPHLPQPFIEVNTPTSGAKG